MRTVLVVWGVFLSAQYLSAQEIVRFRKEKNLVFFQVGEKKDTVSRGAGDVFYFSAGDSLKQVVSVLVDNGRLEQLSGDTLFRLAFLPGLAYESRYFLVEDTAGTQFHEFHPQINGASAWPRNTVRVRIVNRLAGTLIENRYYFRDPG